LSDSAPANRWLLVGSYVLLSMCLVPTARRVLSVPAHAAPELLLSSTAN
jgi:hypothetical protein